MLEIINYRMCISTDLQHNATTVTLLHQHRDLFEGIVGE